MSSAVSEPDVGPARDLSENSKKGMFFVRGRRDASATLEMVASLRMACPDHIPNFSARSTPPSRGARPFSLQAPGHPRDPLPFPQPWSKARQRQAAGPIHRCREWPGACSKNDLAPRLGGVERTEKFGMWSGHDILKDAIISSVALASLRPLTKKM